MMLDLLAPKVVIVRNMQHDLSYAAHEMLLKKEEAGRSQLLSYFFTRTAHIT